MSDASVMIRSWEGRGRQRPEAERVVTPFLLWKKACCLILRPLGSCIKKVDGL